MTARRRLVVAHLAAFAAASACGAAGRQVHNASGDPEPVVRPDPTRDGPKPEHLEVIAVTITSGAAVMFIKADGGIERKGTEGRIATLRTTGELLHENGGLLLTLNPDGTITGTNLQSDQFDDIIIGPNGELSQAGQVLSTITPEGAVIENGKEVAQISGGVRGHRAAMLILLMYLGDEPEPDETVEPGETPTAEPGVEAPPAGETRPTSKPTT